MECNELILVIQLFKVKINQIFVINRNFNEFVLKIPKIPGILVMHIKFKANNCS